MDQSWWLYSTLLPFKLRIPTARGVFYLYSPLANCPGKLARSMLSL